MPTPTLDRSKPIVTDTRQNVADEARDNINALAEAIVGLSLTGYVYSQSGGTAEKPTTMTWTADPYRVKATLTWTGDFVTTVVLEHSENSGGAYSSISSATLTYDGSNNLTGVSGGSSIFHKFFELFGKFLGLRTTVADHVADDVVADGVHGAGTLAGQDANAVAITGGSVNGTTVGGTTKAAGAFTRVRAKVTALGTISGGATATIDMSAAECYTLTAGGNITVNFTNPPPANDYQTCELRCTNFGAYTITWQVIGVAGDIKRPGGAALTFTSSGLDVVIASSAGDGKVHIGVALPDSK